MKKYRMKEIIEAERWFKIGDVPEAEVKHYFGTNKDQECMVCGKILHKHGKILFPDNSYDLLCPGDWLIKYESGKIYPCDNETFIKVYEELIN